MDAVFMSKATFSEVCKVMKHKDGALRQCLDSVVRLSLLFFPGLMCQEFASAAMLEAGMLRVDVKGVVDETVRSIKTVFSRDHEDFAARYDDARIAHVLIVFAAYFDTVKLYLPDESRVITLSGQEKYVLTEKSLLDYEAYLRDRSGRQMTDKGRTLACHDLTIPNPVEGLDRYLEGLERFYTSLNGHFTEFIQGLAFFEEMSDAGRDKFDRFLERVPQWAVENYKKQYNALKAIFPDFFVWSTTQEHASIQRSINVGFQSVSDKLYHISELMSQSRANDTLQLCHSHYRSDVEDQNVAHQVVDAQSHDDVRLPTVAESFVPQAFQALVYRRELRLENTDQWIDHPQADIGDFIADTLRSHELGDKPLLILGHPGAGKTTLCKMLAAKRLHEEYHTIILPLRGVVAEHPIHQQITDQLRNEFGNACSWYDIATSHLSKPILLIFDGYDELLQASGKTHSNYLDTIAQFQQDQHRLYGIFVRCIVTSRITLIDKARIPKNSAVIRLAEFDSQRIGIWSEVWNRYNRDYFADHGLAPFDVESDTKAEELAKQPLLLLMLALFDSNGNALKQHRDLTVPQLYNSLIRQFILREKGKDRSFRALSEEKQREALEREMERVGIAALGMYNRSVLYIRSDQLLSDLEYLTGIRSETELTEGDRVLAGFFFIHRSQATREQDRTREKISAYEFLHNTFGEFLTAHYIVTQTFELLEEIAYLRRKRRDVSMADRRKWYTALSYAPLFQRPVVCRMIRDWAPLYFADQGLDVSEALDQLLDIEVPRVLTGDVMPTLNAVTGESGNGYPKLDAMKHLAVYANNLVSLAALLTKDGLPLKKLERHDPKAWDKLLHLWRYGFTEKEITAFAMYFEIVIPDNQRFLTYDLPPAAALECLFPENNRLMRLYTTHLCLDEVVQYSTLGALGRFSDYKTVIDGLTRQQFDLKASTTLLHLLDDFPGLSYSSQMGPVLADLHRYAIEEQDRAAMRGYYLLLDRLSAHPTPALEGTSFLDPAVLAEELQPTESGMSYPSDIYALILKLLLRTPQLSRGPWDIDREDYTEYDRLLDLFEKICDKFRYIAAVNPLVRKEVFHQHLVLTNRMLRIDSDAQLLSGMYWFQGHCKSLVRSITFMMHQESSSLSDDTVLEVLVLMDNLMAAHLKPQGRNILGCYKEALDRGRFGEHYVIPAEHTVPILSTLRRYYLGKSGNGKKVADWISRFTSGGTTIADIFDCDPNAILDLCYLAETFPQEVGSLILDDLTNLVRSYPDQLPMALCRQLGKLSRLLSCPDLREALDKLLSPITAE